MNITYSEALEMLQRATDENSPARLTRTEIRLQADMSETAFRSFVKGKHPKGQLIHARTLAKNASRIARAVAALQLQKRLAPLAYTAVRTAVGTSDSVIETWLDQHRGAYLCYRFASSDQLIQVSGLRIFESDGRARFTQTFRISNPKFGEGEERNVDGDVHPVRRCAHLVFTGKGQMYHCIFSELEDKAPRYMIGIVAGLSTDGRYPFASRIIAIRFSDTPETDWSSAEGKLGVRFADEDEATRACNLDVIPGHDLPTMARLLSVQDDPGVIRAELSPLRT